MHILQNFKINNLHYVAALGLCLVSTACSALPDWMGAGESDPKLPGERFDVMNIETKLQTDPSVQEDVFDVPETQASITNNFGNYALSGNLESFNTIGFGDDPEEFFDITAQPLAVDDKIIVVDGTNKVTEFSKDLKVLWETQVKSPDEDGQTYPGGISYLDGFVYVTTGFGKVAAINAVDGKLLWENNLKIPLRTAPTISEDKVFVASADNKTFALDKTTGSVIWRHTNVIEKTRKFSSASPAVKGNMVITAYASGEIFALSSLQGREIWGELLSQGLGQTRAAAGLNDISATPLIVDGIIYATNAGGKLVAFNMNNGQRIWEQSIAGIATPWIAGRFLFIINDKQQLIALNRYDGRIKWISELVKNAAKKEKSDDKTEKATWQGPILAAGKLVSHNNKGELLVIEPNTGTVIARHDIPDNVFTPAKVVNGKLYLVTNSAELVEVK